MPCRSQPNICALENGFAPILGVRTFQGLGKNAPTREQVVCRITRDLHSRRLIESLACDSFLRVPLQRKNLLAPILIHVTLRLPSYIDSNHDLLAHRRHWWITPHHFFLRGGGGSTSFSKIGTSVRSMLGTQTLMSMRQFIEDAEKGSNGGFQHRSNLVHTSLHPRLESCSKLGFWPGRPQRFFIILGLPRKRLNFFRAARLS